MVQAWGRLVSGTALIEPQSTPVSQASPCECVYVHLVARRVRFRGVHPLTLVSTLYGQARGYRRLDIRRRVFANEKLPADTLARLNEEEFQHHVHRSLARFPYYAERVKEHRGSLPKPGERVRPEELPVWTREMQRQFFDQQERPADALYLRRSSGSTSTPVAYYATRESYEWRTSIMDRVYAWAGAEEGVRSVHVWGADPRPMQGFQKTKRRVHLLLQRRYFFNAFQEFTDKESAECCDLINRVKPHAIVGYTGMLAEVARFARDHRALHWKSRTIITTAEGLMPGQRELLQDVMGREVFNSYGSREVMNIGSECEKHRGMHMPTDNLRVEIADERGFPMAPGKEGRVLVTDLHNAASPMIRYEVGDIGIMWPDEPCACGRPFPRLASVEGRIQEIIQTPGGPMTLIWLTILLKDYPWVEGFQVVQDHRDQLTLRLVTKRELTSDIIDPLNEALLKRAGNMRFRYERVDRISRRPNGKAQLLVTSL